VRSSRTRLWWLGLLRVRVELIVPERRVALLLGAELLVVALVELQARGLRVVHLRLKRVLHLAVVQVERALVLQAHQVVHVDQACLEAPARVQEAGRCGQACLRG
jgi:hypothetical protein